MADPHELSASIVHHFLTLQRHHQKQRHHLHEKLDISGRQVAVLRYLVQNGPRAVSEISRFLYISDGTTSPLLDRMEKGGFVIRRRCPTDNRRVIVEPTEKGRDVVTKAPLGVIGRMRAYLPGLAQEELETINRAMERLWEIANMDEAEYELR